jgi:hypothetical protein
VQYDNNSGGWQIANYFSYSSRIIVVQAIAPNGFTKEYSVPISNPTRNCIFSPTVISYPNNLPQQQVIFNITGTQPNNMHIRCIPVNIKYGSQYDPPTPWVGSNRGAVYSLSSTSASPTRVPMAITGGPIRITGSDHLNLTAFGYNYYYATDVTWFKGANPVTVVINVTH